MARKRYKPEEIVAKLWQVDFLVSQGRGGAAGWKTHHDAAHDQGDTHVSVPMTRPPRCANGEKG
jgi:hypothetical protein